MFPLTAPNDPLVPTAVLGENSCHVTHQLPSVITHPHLSAPYPPPSVRLHAGPNVARSKAPSHSASRVTWFDLGQVRLCERMVWFDGGFSTTMTSLIHKYFYSHTHTHMAAHIWAVNWNWTETQQKCQIDVWIWLWGNAMMSSGSCYMLPAVCSSFLRRLVPTLLVKHCRY